MIAWFTENIGRQVERGIFRPGINASIRDVIELRISANGLVSEKDV
jgi:hypothetical protein